MKMFRTYLLFFILSLSRTVPFLGCEGVESDRTHFYLLDKDKGGIIQALDTLFKELDVTYDGTLKGAVDETQKKLLRPAHSERWDIQARTDDSKEWLQPCVCLGMIDTRLALKNTYDYALVLGATLTNVRKRVELLKSEWQRGVRFKEIIFLSGERLLRDVERNELTLAGYPNIQSEPAMMRFVYDSAKLPSDVKNIHVRFFEAPAKPGAARATTADSLEAWFATNPLPGSVLAFSSQPVLFYQDAVLKRLVPPAFSIETIGHKAPEDTALGVYTDTIARWLFEEYTRFTKYSDLMLSSLEEHPFKDKIVIQ